MKKKPKIVHEEVKDRHTSHWDLDLLSREELERLMTVAPAPAAANTRTLPDKTTDTDSDSDA